VDTVAPIDHGSVTQTGAQVRASDPAAFVTETRFNADHEVTQVTYPRANRVVYTFDEHAADPLAQGNLLEVRRHPGIAHDGPGEGGKGEQPNDAGPDSASGRRRIPGHVILHGFRVMPRKGGHRRPEGPPYETMGPSLQPADAQASPDDITFGPPSRLRPTT